jgi:hypothetical protein
MLRFRKLVSAKEKSSKRTEYSTSRFFSRKLNSPFLSMFTAPVLVFTDLDCVLFGIGDISVDTGVKRTKLTKRFKENVGKQ